LAWVRTGGSQVTRAAVGLTSLSSSLRGAPSITEHQTIYTDKKERKKLLIYREIQMGSYMRKDFLICIRKCTNIFTIYEEVVSHT
jgi:hypothetical protein